jgi:hypothetical protein
MIIIKTTTSSDMTPFRLLVNSVSQELPFPSSEERKKSSRLHQNVDVYIPNGTASYSEKPES